MTTTQSLLGLINAYLAPVLLAVPVAVLLLLLGMRRGADDEDAAAHARREAGRALPAPAAQNAPATTTSATAAAAPALPVAPAAPAAPAAAGLVEAASVLVVDDSAVVRTKLRRLLEGAGYRVLQAADGEQALEVLAREPVSLLLTDLEMPNMDGFALIAAVQGSLETEHLPIVAITGHEELRARVQDCQGLYGLLRKPWNDRQLLDRVAALVALDRRSTPTLHPA